MPKTYLITTAPKRPRLDRNINKIKPFAKIVQPTAVLVALAVGVAFAGEAMESNKYK